jgi:hypothetical protein
MQERVVDHIEDYNSLGQFCLQQYTDIEFCIVNQ